MALESLGRSYGKWCSSVIMMTQPVKPSWRSRSTHDAPPAPYHIDAHSVTCIIINFYPSSFIKYCTCISTFIRAWYSYAVLHKKIKNCHKALAVIISLTILCHQIYTIQLVYYCSTTHTSSNHHKSCQVFWISLCHLLCSFLRGQKGFIGSDLDLSICHTYVILGYTVQPRIVLNVSCNKWNTISKVSLKNWTGNFSLCK